MEKEELLRILNSVPDEDAHYIECQGFNPELMQDTYFQIHDFSVDLESGAIILWLKYNYD